MKQLKTTDELIGKTIKSISEINCPGKLVVKFTDDTLVIFSSYGDATVIFDAELDIDDQVEIGLMSQEEYDRRVQDEQTRAKQERESHERSEYERLHKKYGVRFIQGTVTVLNVDKGIAVETQEKDCE